MPAAIQQSLLCHPTSSSAAVHAIQVSTRWMDDGSLALSYDIDCNPDLVLLPAVQPSGPGDGLWQHTCCEAFIAAVDHPEYREFNFSPDTRWANYRFTDYRTRDIEFKPAGAPQIAFRQRASGFLLEALLARELLPAGPRLELGLSVVIEYADHSKSYWALKHCAAQPDFHHRQSFKLTLNTANP